MCSLRKALQSQLPRTCCDVRSAIDCSAACDQSLLSGAASWYLTFVSCPWKEQEQHKATLQQYCGTVSLRGNWTAEPFCRTLCVSTTWKQWSEFQKSNLAHLSKMSRAPDKYWFSNKFRITVDQFQLLWRTWPTYEIKALDVCYIIYVANSTGFGFGLRASCALFHTC